MFFQVIFVFIIVLVYGEYFHILRHLHLTNLHPINKYYVLQEVMNIGNNQDPFVKKKQYTDGEYDKKTMTIDNNGNYVPNVPTNSEILRS